MAPKGARIASHRIEGYYMSTQCHLLERSQWGRIDICAWEAIYANRYHSIYADLSFHEQFKTVHISITHIVLIVFHDIKEQVYAKVI